MTVPDDSLRRCPDCGGILDAVRPEYVFRLDAEAALDDGQKTLHVWRCFICGYHEVPAANGLIAEV